MHLLCIIAHSGRDKRFYGLLPKSAVTDFADFDNTEYLGTRRFYISNTEDVCSRGHTTIWL